jgi:hypothetical protein
MANDEIKELQGIGKKLLDDGADQLVALVKNQVKMAAAEWKDIGPAAAEIGKKVTAKMALVTTMVANGDLDADDGEAIMAKLWSSVRNLEKAALHQASKQSYFRGKALLTGAQNIAFGLLTAGASLAAPAAGRLMGKGFAALIEAFD